MDDENMDATFRSVFRDVSPSVVIVEQIRRIDKFCAGSIILNEKDENTFILTQAEILDSSANLAVRFFDGSKLPATLLIRTEKICILTTKFHSKCKAVEFSEGDNIDHTYGVTIAPETKSSVYNIPGFIIKKSLEAGCYNDEMLVPGTETHLTFSCLYGDRSSNGVSRVTYGPVFDMDRKVIGFIVDDMEYDCPTEDDGKDYQGTDLKVVESSSSLQATLINILEDSDWKKGLLWTSLVTNVVIT